MPLALSLPLAPLTHRQSVDLAVHCWGLGYRQVWLAEVAGPDAVSLGGALAHALPGLRIGTAVLPAQTRTPMVHAMTAAGLSQLTGGRFVLGLGISSENIVGDWAGLAYDRPLRRMREHVEVIRAMLAGGKTAYDGDTLASHRFRLQAAPEGPVPIHVAALNPGMLRLAGEVADGVIVNLLSEEAVPRVLAEVAAGAAAAGRDPGGIEVVCRLHVHVTDDRDAARDAIRAAFGAYAATAAYNRFFAWIGHEDVAAGVREAFARGDRGAVAAAMTDEFVDAIAVIGPLEEVAARVRAYHDAGVDVPVLAPFWPDPVGQRGILGDLAGCLG